jgi:hypothetical protein
LQWLSGCAGRIMLCPPQSGEVRNVRATGVQAIFVSRHETMKAYRLPSKKLADNSLIRYYSLVALEAKNWLTLITRKGGGFALPVRP